MHLETAVDDLKSLTLLLSEGEFVFSLKSQDFVNVNTFLLIMFVVVVYFLLILHNKIWFELHKVNELMIYKL